MKPGVTRCRHYEYPDASINLFDIDTERMQQFKRTLDGTALGEKVHTCSDLAEDAKKAKLIVLLTTDKKPFFRSGWIMPGTTVLGMGSYQQVEDDFALTCDKIITDSWEQAKHRGELEHLSKDGSISDDHLYAQLSDIVMGAMAGRESDTEKIFGLPIGLGAYDIAIADIVCEKAIAAGDGLSVSIQQT